MWHSDFGQPLPGSTTNVTHYARVDWLETQSKIQVVRAQYLAEHSFPSLNPLHAFVLDSRLDCNREAQCDTEHKSSCVNYRIEVAITQVPAQDTVQQETSVV
jgi:hypothetical protein